MKTKLYLFIAFRIIFIFSIAMAASFLPEHLRIFFGDTKFVPYSTSFGLRVVDDGLIDPYWNWGARHYWFFWMMVLLFLLSIIDAIISIIKSVEKHYPELK